MVQPPPPPVCRACLPRAGGVGLSQGGTCTDSLLSQMCSSPSRGLLGPQGEGVRPTAPIHRVGVAVGTLPAPLTGGLDTLSGQPTAPIQQAPQSISHLVAPATAERGVQKASSFLQGAGETPKALTAP